MEFRLLGLLDVGEDDRAIELAGGRERALLALLLLQANQPVSTDRLIEELWGDRPPEKAAKGLQVYVSRLRKALGADRLRTTPAGYALEVRPGELDSAEFERLVGEGRKALEEGDATRGERALSEALALWRGLALADFRFESFAQPEIRRLEELQAAARADRVEARLSNGRSDGVVAELEQLIDENPLWERPRGQLMRALYRSGRQADALELYRRTRALLAEEQGLEPSPELQALERAILNQEPELDVPRGQVWLGATRRAGAVRLLIGAGLILAAATAATVVALTRGGSPGLTVVGAGSLASIDPETSRVAGAVGIADVPARIAAGARSLWVGNDAAGTVSEVDPGSYSVRRVVVTGGFPSDIAVGEGAVWVIDARSGRLAKVDPTYGVVSVRRRVLSSNGVAELDRQGLDPTSIAAGAGAVWVTDGSTKLRRIDPATATVAQTIDKGLQLNDVATTPDAVWAVSGPAAKVLRLDPAGGETARVTIVSRPGFESPYPLAVAVGADFVWVLNGNTSTVTKIDPRRRTVVTTIPIGVERLPVRLAAGHGAAWVANGDGSVSRIDAATNDVTTISVGHRLKDIAVDKAGVWVTTGVGLAANTGAVAPSGSAGRVRALPGTACSPLYFQAGAKPAVLIASDLPLQGPIRTVSGQMSQAIQLVLKSHRFRAGSHSIAYQSCDDSTVQEHFASPGRCERNAVAYAGDLSVIALIAPFNSSCTEIELPIANSAPGGPLPMVSFSDTYLGFTRSGAGTPSDEPSRFYPSGVRSYVRIIAADDYQGAANAVLARRLGSKSVYIVREPYPYGQGIADSFRLAAARIGLRVIGVSEWDPTASAYGALARRVRRSGGDAVFVAGPLFDKGHLVVRDLRAALGPRFPIITPDGFTLPDAIQLLGADAEGMTISVPGLPTERLPRKGRAFAAAFRKAIGARPYPYAVYAAQAAELLVKAIAASDGTRASVRKNLFGAKVAGGILGDFAIDAHGDTTRNAITIFRIEHGRAVVFDVITPSARLVKP